MSRTRWIVVSVIVAALVLLAWLWATPRGAPAREAGPGPVVESKSMPVANTDAQTTAGMVPQPPQAASPRDYAAGYHDADDLLVYLNSLAPAADAGDANAMYWMFRASSRCTRDYLLYLGGPVRSRSLESALAVNASGRMDEKSTREIYAKCAAFRGATDNPYRDYLALLRRAADAGQAVAKATLAHELCSQRVRAANLRVAPAAMAKLDEEIHALARDALRSRDPAALYELGMVASEFMEPTDVDAHGGSRQRSDEQDVWLIAACQRGFDCSMDNEQFRIPCALDDACQPNDSIVDMLRRLRPEKFPAMELRATDLNAMLDAGRFDDIDL